VFKGRATAAELGGVTGVALSPRDVMDLLAGIAPADVTEYRADWGPRAPRRVRARTSDGTRLDVRVEDPRPGAPLADAAFTPPAHAGYRPVDALEARDLWVVRR
jgi:hypothetical protein